jgi:hypothetical protein
MAVL